MFEKPDAIFSGQQSPWHNRADLEQKLEQMRRVSSAFYREAIQINNHTFIEFCGLMNKYIDICRHTMNSGSDFTQCSIHSGAGLTVQSHDIKYLAEKFGCIFEVAFEKEELRHEFMCAMGWGEYVEAYQEKKN